MRNWDEKILVGACALLVALVGTVWALSFGTLNGRCTDTETDINVIQESIKTHGERIKFLEATQEENKRRLERIENKLDTVIIHVNR